MEFTMKTTTKTSQTTLKDQLLPEKRPRWRPRKTPEQAAHDKALREYFKRQEAHRLQRMADLTQARAIEDWFNW
jgi:hypothetical protein